MLLCSFFGPSGCAAERLNLSALRRLRLRGTERQLPLMGFKDHPKCFGTKTYFSLEGPGLQCLHCRPSSSRSHASRSSALVVSTTSAVLAFQPVERCLHPSCRPWGLHRPALTCLSTTSDPPTHCRPSKCSPHRQRPPSSHHLLLSQRLASWLVAPLSSLAHVRRLSALLRCVGVNRDLRVFLRW